MRTPEESRLLRDAITDEVWYGLNMSMTIMTDLTEEEVTALRSFVEKCKKGRKAI